MYDNVKSLGVCEAPVRQVEISKELDALGVSINDLRCVVAELAKKITPILANTPSACYPEEAETTALTVIGGVLRGHSKAVLEIRQTVVDLISKVEV
jgi:hypothetical protein